MEKIRILTIENIVLCPMLRSFYCKDKQVFSVGNHPLQSILFSNSLSSISTTIALIPILV